MNVPADSPTCEHWQILLSGDVQGGGIRPRLAQLAANFQVSGSVRNSRSGVELKIIAAPTVLQQFVEHLRLREPQAQITFLNRSGAASSSVSAEFRIDTSDSTGAAEYFLPLDRVICEACLAEIFQPTNRRFRYPFNSCPRCGPRYSLLRAMPYDRERTSMADFAMCAACIVEYRDIQDARYHSQLNACPQCGPRLWLAGNSPSHHHADYDAIVAAAERIRAGGILALKGIGGYQLVCDATSHSAVTTLRNRKGRPSKPLAVMTTSLAEAQRLAYLDPIEQQALCSSIGPIVLVRARADHGLAENIHPRLSEVGLMLPTTALHALLLAVLDRPLVVTSGNVEGEPIEYDPMSASQRLSSIADCFLHHNRTIEQPIDDSVVRCMAGRTVTIRAARGLAPMPLNCDLPQSMLAVGGEQKVALGMANSSTAFLGPHLGDMDSLGNQARFRQHQHDLARLLACSPRAMIADQHPDYFTSRWTHETATVPVHAIQHHYAHILAGMLEHDWLDQQVLGFAFDGTGLGPDGTVWGGEVLLATRQHYQQVASLRPFALAGGEMAIRQPWRIAISLMTSALDMDVVTMADFLGLQLPQFQSVASILRVPQLSPVTTSIGRLFDGIAAIVLAVHENRFEGDAASQLEACCDQAATGAYALPLTPSMPAQWDWQPLIRDLVAQRMAGETPGVLAMRFHRSIAQGMAQIAESYPHNRIVCMGGVFQNRVLCEMLRDIWWQRTAPVGLPGRIPPGDGGLAAGQLAALSAVSITERSLHVPRYSRPSP